MSNPFLRLRAHGTDIKNPFFDKLSFRAQFIFRLTRIRTRQPQTMKFVS